MSVVDPKVPVLILDDLSVATGRPSALPEGPSGAHDVVSYLEQILTAYVAKTTGVGDCYGNGGESSVGGSADLL